MAHPVINPCCPSATAKTVRMTSPDTSRTAGSAALILYRTFYIITRHAESAAVHGADATAGHDRGDAPRAGMARAGIKAIVQRSGTPIGSLYHYFPGGKMQLVTESLRRHAEKLPLLMERHFDGKRPAAAAVREFRGCRLRIRTRRRDQSLRRRRGHPGPVVSDAQVRTVCNDALQQWVRSISAQLPFPDPRARTSFAVLVVAALEGAFILAKAAQSGETFRQVGNQLAAAALPLDARRAAVRRRRSRTPRKR